MTLASFSSGKRVDNKISSSNFDCIEIRVIFINRYVRTIIGQLIQLRLQRNSRYFHHWLKSSNCLSNSRFHCSETRVTFVTGYAGVYTYSYSRFHCSETYSYSRFHCSETRVIFITGYVAEITLVIPASTAVRHSSFSSADTLQQLLIAIPASIAVKHAIFPSSDTV